MQMKPKITIPELALMSEVTRQYIHKQLKEKEIIPEKKGSMTYLNHTLARKYFNFKFKPIVLAMHIVKGGVGKTTLSQAIGIRASLYGARVLFIDIDPQGNLTEGFNVDPYKGPVMIDLINDKLPIDDAILNVLPGIDILPSRLENINLDNTLMLQRNPLDKVFAKYINSIKHNYDLIIFDCPPALGSSVTAAVLTTDLVVAPLIPAKYAKSALEILMKEKKNIKESFNKNINLKIILNNFDSRKKKSHKTLSDIMGNKKYTPLMFGSFVRTSQAFENILDDNESIFDTTKWTSEKEDIDLITREILDIERLLENA